MSLIHSTEVSICPPLNSCQRALTAPHRPHSSVLTTVGHHYLFLLLTWFLAGSSPPVLAIPPDNALSFNGASNYVQMNDVNLGTSNFTLEGWIKPNNVNSGYIYTSRTSEVGMNGNWFGLVFESGKIILYLADSGISGAAMGLSTNATFTTNVWYHIAAVKSSTAITLYVNGQLNNQITDTFTRNLTTGNQTTFGYWAYGGGTGWFSGEIDEFRVWNTALSQAQIHANLHNTLLGNETNLVAYYNFNQSPGTTLQDLTGYGHNGTINGATWTTSNALCPFPIAATNVGTTDFTATWNAVSGATKYRLDVGSDTAFSTLVANNLDVGAGTSFDLTGLTLPLGTQYYYRMRVEKGAWTSPNSAPVMLSPGNMLSFNGTSRYVMVPYQSTLNSNQFTAEAWAKVSGGTGAYRTVIGNRLPSPLGGFLLRANNSNRWDFILGGGGSWQGVTGPSIVLNQWVHLAATYDGSNAKFYINGVLQGTQTVTSYQPNTAQPFTIGSYNDAAQLFFNGQIDEVRFWNVARTQTDIQSNLYKTLAGNEAGLVAYYNFDQTSGTLLPDLTGHGHDGTLVNTPTWTTATWNYGYPYIATGTTSAITDISAGVGGNVIGDGIPSLSASGVCYGTSASPTTPCTTDGTTLGTFTSTLTGLTPNTLYYAREYATNDRATVYGNDVTFTTLMGNQVISFTPPTSATYGDALLTLTATGGNSGNPVTFTSTTPAVCTTGGTNGATLTLLTTGTCTVTANQTGNANYNPASPVSSNITIQLATQTLFFTPLPGVTLGDSPVTLTATASSGLPVTLTSTTPSVCTVSNATLYAVGVGVCTVVASQAGNLNYSAAASVTQQVNVMIVSPRTLHMVLAGDGQGRVTSDPPGLDCTATTGSICDYTNGAPQWVTLIATPATGSEFIGWSGEAACTALGQILTVQNTSCTATFKLKNYQLTANFLGKGRVTGPGIDCPGQCTANYPYGTTVTLQAQVTRNMWNFSGWQGCDSQGQIQITNDVLCQAIFTPDPNIPNAGDGNGDGLKDANQENVVSLPDKVKGSYLTLEAQPATCIVNEIYPDLAESQTVKLDHNKKFVQGMLYFDLACPQAQVSIYYHGMSKISRNLKFYKFGPKVPGDLTTLAWYQLPNIKYEVVTIGGKPVVKGTYTLTDGQLGDSTGVDGHIIDPIGLADVVE